MAELTDLLKSVETELTGKIKEIYEKKLEEHIKNISSNLSKNSIQPIYYISNIS